MAGELTERQRKETRAVSTARFFHVRLDAERWVEVRVVAFDDVGLPTPHEPAEWRPRRPSREEVLRALELVGKHPIGL